MLKMGDRAPLDIPLVDESETRFTLREMLGSWIVVYFYPKDDTPGCTLEAEGFRDQVGAFKELNARVLGVSKDTCASHRKFIEKKELTFTLVADTEHALMEAFGTWGERSFMGRTYLGTSRSTFLLDPDGMVAHVWEKVTPAGHPQEVLSALRAMHDHGRQAGR